MKTKYLPFSGEMIYEAGVLLAKRHTRNRRMLPLLPARFEDPEVAAKAIEDLWQSKFKNGYAAFRNEKMVAYLIGDFENMPWARSGYVYLHGYALAEGESAAILQDLYALLGEDWVRKGIFSHNLYISPQTVYLATAATKPEARNRGIANALTWQGLKEARKEGFEVCLVNWVSSNLLAARYWPRFGFQEAAYRLSKQVNPMSAWARP